MTNMISSSVIQFPSFALAQVQQNFTTNLVGEDVVPPTNTKATGTSEFTLSSDGMSMNYEVNVQGYKWCHTGSNISRAKR